MPEASGSPGAPNGADAAHTPGGQLGVDVYALAEKVYALMVAEVRLSHSRTDSLAAPRRPVED